MHCTSDIVQTILPLLLAQCLMKLWILVRHYILDLMRTTPRDANYTGPGFRHAVLRPELVAAFCQVSAAC